MKFKTVIIFFNVVMFLFLGIVFLMPLAILGKDMAGSFWGSLWFVAPLMVIALVIIDLYFASNCKIYTLLEKEDWPALIQELEDKVIQKGNYSPRLVKLLINSYLVLSDVKSVTELEKKLSIARPGLVNENALAFGASRILRKDYQGAAEFFAPRCSGEIKQTGAAAEWLRWYYGFSLLLSRRFDEAADVFTLMGRESRESIPAGLSAYFLSENLASFLPLRSKKLKEDAAAAKERVTRKLSRRHNWTAELKRLDTEVYAAVLQNYTGKAADYLYA